MDTVKLKKGRYILAREGDGAGESGFHLISMTWPKEVEVGDRVSLKDVTSHPREIRVGGCVECGSHYARTFGPDWWRTSVVTEILDTKEDAEGVTEVKFKTLNSTYTVKVV